jgi:cytochrome oxidase assembly protein ShyY1
LLLSLAETFWAIEDPNRHLEYALTWFGLAAALAVVYGFAISRN